LHNFLITPVLNHMNKVKKYRTGCPSLTTLPDVDTDITKLFNK